MSDSTLTTHRRRPQERPDEILAAALEEFSQHGLAGARVADIAARAGVSKGTVYLYFETKDDLFRAVIRTTLEDAVAMMADAAVGETATARIEAVLPAFWAFLRSDRFEAVYRLIYATLHQFPELARFYNAEVSGRMSAFIAELLGEGVERGEFRPVDPAIAARMLVVLCVKHALWLSRQDLFNHLEGQSDEQVLADIASFFFSAIQLP